MNDRQILDSITDRYMEEAGEDIHYALRLLAFDFHRLSGMVSSGYGRFAPLTRSGFLPKTRVEAIDIPAPASQEAASPNS